MNENWMKGFTNGFRDRVKRETRSLSEVLQYLKDTDDDYADILAKNPGLDSGKRAKLYAALYGDHHYHVGFLAGWTSLLVRAL